MKLSAILLGTILFAAFSTPAQTNFAQVSFAAPTFGVTPAVAAVSPLNSVSLAEPFASSPALPPAAMPAPEPVPQGVQGVFEKYSYDVYVGYTFFRFYEVPGVESSMNGVNGSFVYWYHDRIGLDAEVFATYGSQPGQNGTRLAGRDPGQAGGRRSGDVGAGMHPEQPEYSRCPVAELPVGPPERCPHADGAVCAEHV